VRKFDLPPDLTSLTRRSLLQGGSAAALLGLVPRNWATSPPPRAVSSAPHPADKSKSFPDQFLWGCATAGHQVEGNNIASDLWALEHVSNGMFREPSGDACDHYHLYAQDIAMLAELGFNSYRFSIEWSRIEPAEGQFSNAELDHYRRVLAACREHHLTTLVTFSHFSMPLWFARKGAWSNPAAPDLFARYCERASKYLGHMIDFASTFNEPNIPQLLNWMPLASGPSMTETFAQALAGARAALNAPEFAGFFLGDGNRIRDGLLASHGKGQAAMKSARPTMPVGFNLAMSDDQPTPADNHVAEKRADIYGPWLEAARTCDYLGVQAYTRAVVGKKDLPPPSGAELTQMGYEFYPECVEGVVRYAAKEARVPIYVTENGVATDDDRRRIEYYRRALTSLKRAIDDGADVRGYVCWSLLDNWEWMFGYAPKFGIVAVDRTTQTRTIKPSGAYLGNIARRNAL